MVDLLERLKFNLMIKIKRAKNGEFFFTVQARNGQVIVTSETYKSKRVAIKGICAIERAFKNVSRKDIKDETAKPVKKKWRLI